MTSLTEYLKNLRLLVPFKNRNCSWSLYFFRFSLNAVSACMYPEAHFQWAKPKSRMELGKQMALPFGNNLHISQRQITLSRQMQFVLLSPYFISWPIIYMLSNFKKITEVLQIICNLSEKYIKTKESLQKRSYCHFVFVLLKGQCFYVSTFQFFLFCCLII